MSLQRIWDQAHQEKSASSQSEAAVVNFMTNIQPYLAENAVLLDAGCGRGRNSKYLSQLGFIVISDISLVALEIARSKLLDADQSADFQVANLSRLPYRKNLFSAIICVKVFPYHYPVEIFQIIHEFRRVLQPGGWLYLDLLDRSDAEYACGPLL